MNTKSGFWKKPEFQTIIASIACAILGIICGFIILLLMNPAHAFEGIIAVLRNFFKFSNNTKNLMYYAGSTLVKSVPVILCAEAILFAYKAGLFNIGVAGQYTVGILASIYCSLALHWNWVFCLLAAVAAGALSGALAGVSHPCSTTVSAGVSGLPAGSSPAAKAVMPKAIVKHRIIARTAISITECFLRISKINLHIMLLLL